MKNENTCKITLDVTGFGYSYLLQLLDMADETPEENGAAAETLREWIGGNAEHFLDDARDARDVPAIDLFERLLPEEPRRVCQTVEADDEKAERLENIAICRGFDVSLICNTNAGGYTTTVDIIGPEEDTNALLRAYEREQAERPAPRDQADAYDAVAEYLGSPENDFLKEILAEASLDAKQDSTNLFKAGQFLGTARMLAAAIVNDGASRGESVAMIIAAVYDYCGIAQ